MRKRHLDPSYSFLQLDGLQPQRWRWFRDKTAANDGEIEINALLLTLWLSPAHRDSLEPPHKHRQRQRVTFPERWCPPSDPIISCLPERQKYLESSLLLLPWLRESGFKPLSSWKSPDDVATYEKDKVHHGHVSSKREKVWGSNTRICQTRNHSSTCWSSSCRGEETPTPPDALPDLPPFPGKGPLPQTWR